MGGKSAPPIPPPPPLPPLQPINIMAPSLPPMPAPIPVPIRDEEYEGAPTTEEIAKKAKLEKDKLKNKPGGPKGTQFTGTGLLLDPEVSEENLYKPLIS
jgi:hypothetical protein